MTTTSEELIASLAPMTIKSLEELLLCAADKAKFSQMIADALKEAWEQGYESGLDNGYMNGYMAATTED